MKIKGKVHCFFEQSGTFKNEFIKLGIPAEDYDIQDNFGQTDHRCDLFKAIEDAYDGRPSLFDNTTPDDLIMAFFPCIMFSCLAQMNITINAYNGRGARKERMGDYILGRIEKRERFYKLLVKLCMACIERRIRIVVENPYAMNTYLKDNFIAPPTIVDEDRTRRGDYFVKPTGYWFFCCEPTNGFTRQRTPTGQRKYFVVHTEQKRGWKRAAKPSTGDGMCSEERSMISPDYARNFICDNILGRKQPEIDRQLEFGF